MSFGQLPYLFKTKPKINYKQTKKSPSPQGSVCLCLLLLFWFQDDVWAERVTGGKVTRKATKHEQFKGWKTVLCFQTLAKYRLLTCMPLDRTHCSLNFMDSEWDANMGGGRAINLLTLIQSWTLKYVHELFLKESKAELLSPVFEYWKSFVILEKHS